MADKAFGVKDINLIGASGTPTIESPNNLNINAVNVAISTDITVAGKVSLGAGTSISSPAANKLTFGTNSQERVSIDSGGLVAVGKTDPSLYHSSTNALVVARGRTNDGITIDCSNQAGIFFSNGSNGAVDINGQLIFYHTTNDESMRAVVKGSEKVRIDKNGRVNIANSTITNDDFQLQVESVEGTPAAKFYRKRNTAGGGLIEIFDDVGGTETRQFHFATGGNLTLDKGNLVIGTSGQGIDFSATGDGSGTMSSELLDDYEEGSWTPDLQFNGAKVNLTYANRWGRYTKIGKQVTVIGRITLSSKGSSGGNARFFGLPYATESITGTQMSIGSLWYSGFNLQGSIVQVVIRTDGNGNSFVEPKGVTTNVEDAIGDSDFANNTDMVFTITYTTA